MSVHISCLLRSLPAQRLAPAALVLTVALFGSAASLRADPIALPPADQAKVDDAVAKGVAFLKSTQGPDGTWAKDANHKVGYAALGGLTLLQCGESAGSPEVLRALNFVRSSLEKLDGTYELALAILFLDRFDAVNVGVLQSVRQQNKFVIEVLTLRLMAGQTITGGWLYSCPVLSGQELTLFKRALLQPKPKLTGLPDSVRKLAVLQDPSKLMAKAPPPPPTGQAIPGASDNSNTHFAVLAIWAAQRIGVPVEKSVRLIGKHYRTSQNSDGSWGYSYGYGGNQPASPPMTCAGLLGIAVEHGYKVKQSDKKMSPQLRNVLPAATAVPLPAPPFLFLAAAGMDSLQQNKDPLVTKGFEALGSYVSQPAGKFKDVAQGNLYFLWAVERVAMLYDLPMIGNKDWYRWGAEMLVANQKPDGSWLNGGFPGESAAINTCFALLFLEQTNLARDLTGNLKIAANPAPAPPPPPPPPPVPSAAPPTPAPTPPAPEPAKESPPAPVAATPTPAAPAPVQEEPKSNRLLLMIALGGVGLLLLGGGAVLVILSMQGRSAGDAEPRGPAKRKRVVERANGEGNGRERVKIRKKSGPSRSRE